MTTAHGYRDASNTLQHEPLGQVFPTASYDASGRRITKAITGTGLTDCTYHYYLSGQSVIEERDGSNNLLKQHVQSGSCRLTYVDKLLSTRVNSNPVCHKLLSSRLSLLASGKPIIPETNR